MGENITFPQLRWRVVKISIFTIGVGGRTKKIVPHVVVK